MNPDIIILCLTIAASVGGGAWMIAYRLGGIEKGLSARIEGLDKHFGARIDGLDKHFGAHIDGLDRRIGNLESEVRGINEFLRRNDAVASSAP
ncbi:MAG: hypothetical protein HAW59_01110 [Betaproteobacteria bacterium]|nr:hypothetical protein [Betaproteobacteria bacterium]